MSNELRIIPAEPAHVPLILQFIQELAEYEKLTDTVFATEELLHASLFGANTVSVSISTATVREWLIVHDARHTLLSCSQKRHHMVRVRAVPLNTGVPRKAPRHLCAIRLRRLRIAAML